MLFRFPPDARWNPERPVVEFGIGVGALPAGADTRAQRALFHYRQNGTQRAKEQHRIWGNIPGTAPSARLGIGGQTGSILRAEGQQEVSRPDDRARFGQLGKAFRCSVGTGAARRAHPRSSCRTHAGRSAARIGM